MKASRQCRTWLDEAIASRPPGSRLPPDRQIARRFGLAPITVKRIMADSAARGRIVRLQGKGTYTPPGPSSPAVVEGTDAPSGVERVMREIEEGIGTGRYKRGMVVPAYRTLCDDFSVSTATVRAALGELVARNVIGKKGKHYYIGSASAPARTRTYNRRVHVFYHDRCGLEQLFGEGSALCSFKTLENELSSHGYILYFEDIRALEKRAREWLAGDSYPYGIILADTIRGFMDEEYFAVLPHLKKIARRAQRFSPRVVVFSISPRAARARLRRSILISKGHMDTVLMRTAADYIHARARTGVTFFFDESRIERNFFVNIIRFITEMLHLQPRCPYRVAVRTDEDDLSIFAFFKRIFSQISHVEQHVEVRLSKYRPHRIDAFLSRVVVTPDFGSVFSACLDTDTWLFSGDDGALRALEWAGAAGVRVPGDLWIIGFENDPRRYPHGITSCVYDADTVGYQIAHVIIGDIPVVKSSRGYLQTHARIIRRRTTS